MQSITTIFLGRFAWLRLAGEISFNNAPNKTLCWNLKWHIYMRPLTMVIHFSNFYLWNLLYICFVKKRILICYKLVEICIYKNKDFKKLYIDKLIKKLRNSFCSSNFPPSILNDCLLHIRVRLEELFEKEHF